MKYKEINKLTTDQARSKIDSIKKDLFNLRFKKINGQLEDSSKMSILKKDIAKLLTKLNTKK